MELLGLALAGFAMVAVVFAVGVAIEILTTRLLGVSRTPRHDPELQPHQQAVRSQLGGFGPQGGSGN